MSASSILPPDDDPVSFSSLPTLHGGDPNALGRIDHYDLLRKLGGGGFGVVYLAKDSNSGVEVALKTLHPLLKTNAEEMDALREKFALVSRLTHTNIAKALVLHRVADVNIWDEAARKEMRLSPGDSVMVMDYAPGVTLSRWRRQFPDGVVPLDLALDIARQVASALDYAHGERIVHRDIKPGNIMVETLRADEPRGASDHEVEKQDGIKNGGASRPGEPPSVYSVYSVVGKQRLRVRLLDFGLAAEIRSSMSRVSTETGDTSGTRPYMAPEQWLGRKQDGSTDQYALACVLYEMLSGAPPFAGVFETGDPAIMKDAVVRDAPEEIEDVPEAVNAALVRALAKTPKERFPSCIAFVESLAQSSRSPQRDSNAGDGGASPPSEPPLVIRDSSLVTPPPPARQEVSPHLDSAAKTFRRSALPWIAVAVVALAAGVFVFKGGKTVKSKPSGTVVSLEPVEEAPVVLDVPASSVESFPVAEPPADPVSPEIDRFKAEATRRTGGVSKWRAIDDAFFRERFEELDRRKSLLDGFSRASELDAAKSAAVAIDRTVDWIEENGTAFREVDSLKGDIEALVVASAAVDAEKYAVDRLRQAKAAEGGAKRLFAAGDFTGARDKFAEAKRSFSDALKEAGKAKTEADKKAREEAARIAKEKTEAARKAEVERKAAEEAGRKLAEELKGPKPGERGGDVLSVTIGRVTFNLRWCPPGTFMMGSPSGEQGRDDDETQHQVTLSKGFWLGETEVTQGQWKALMDGETIIDLARKALRDDTKYMLGGKRRTHRSFHGMARDDDPSGICGDPDDAIPVYHVSWEDAVRFCRRLTERERSAGRLPEGYEYRLPTEAEWEYACRAGTTTALPNGRDIVILGDNNAPALDDIAWYSGNSSVGFKGSGWDTSGWKDKQYRGGRAAPRAVGTKKPNDWGLYDMLGNVWEWCADWFGNYPSGSVTNPTGPGTGVYRVPRGGSWSNVARYCRSAYRCSYDPGARYIGLGFRVALAPVR